MSDDSLNDSNNTITAPAKTDISHIHDFLGAPTPKAWLDAAVHDLPTLIQDHANCEKKAAGTAMNLIFRYEFHQELQMKLAQLIREEMLHYEQVVGIMEERGQKWRHLPASRYAKGMLKHKRTYEPAAMIDILIIGAFIEARSCERFAALSDVIEDEKLAKYYRYLLKSESRHYEDYISLARSLEPKKGATVDLEALSKATNGSINTNEETMNVDQRIAFFREIEAELITSPDSELRFHSGIPT
ncbi:tRNA-(ms[2]io[6]A)-hydroxylase [Psychrobacter sanguinis]|uniref:tRNA-(ms[2]io[6]A)-hydroxylase n=1 Tax=Psychrobacter sanguinis TaxID=861445 RepID=UPI0028A71B1F|nr:tRNA-(ms[2]io[6]A)-hydroxylase [Psychrobacter sanguinis]